MLANRVRQPIVVPGAAPFDAWCARSEDVIIGKLKAWAESGHRRHETDIYEMIELINDMKWVLQIKEMIL